MSMSVGLWIGRTSAERAGSAITTLQATTGETAAVSPTSSRICSSTAMADPGIKHGVEHVDDEVHDHEARGHEQHHALQDDEVTGVDGADQQAADARQGEDGLDDQGAADQASDV